MLSDINTGGCIDITGCRTLASVVLGCLSVIFICTWVAIHPNIPKERGSSTPWKHTVAVHWNNIMLMVIAFLAPELIVLWAMRQRYSAAAIGNRFNKKYGWETTHGFFLLMGGFSYYHDKEWVRLGYEHVDSGVTKSQHETTEAFRSVHQDVEKGPSSLRSRSPQASSSTAVVSRRDEARTPIYPSGVPDLEYLLAKGYITITKNEIQDRSRADIITKVIAVLQTLWFLLQVGARWAQGLAITELEIITVAFAVLNFCTYIAWWSKPLRVQYPIRIQRKREDHQSPDCKAESPWGEFLKSHRWVRAALAYLWGKMVKDLAEPFKSASELKLGMIPCTFIFAEISILDNKLYRKLPSGHRSSSISSFIWRALTYLRTGTMKLVTYLSIFIKVVLVLVKVLLVIFFTALSIALGMVVGLVLSTPFLILALLIIAIASAVFFVALAVFLPFMILAVPFKLVRTLPGMGQEIVQMVKCILLDDDNEKLITTISSGFRGDSFTVYLLVYALGTIFGAIHCIAWVFQFPTTTELLLWRISAIAITATPLLFGFFHSYHPPQHDPVQASPMKIGKDEEPQLPMTSGWRVAADVGFVTISIAYVIFRIILIVLALMAFRDLPASAYQSVQWSYFLPHIG